VSATEGFRPDWNDGIYAYTAAVGSFSANVTDSTIWRETSWNGATTGTVQVTTAQVLIITQEGLVAGVVAFFAGPAWSHDTFYCRAAVHFDDYPNYRYGSYGFRVVRDLESGFVL
jgi:formylglycine-generating enzyme required for sulfatase activity